MKLVLDLNTADGYRTFLKVKALPVYSFTGREAWFPDEYAAAVGVGRPEASAGAEYAPRPWLFDYQAAIARTAVAKRKYAVFADCGLGKTVILLEFARHAAAALPKAKRVLIVSPLMVVRQTIAEAAKFYGAELPIEQVRAKDLAAWMAGRGGRVGITNYEALTDSLPDNHDVGALIADEGSTMKSHYGKWGQRLIELGRGVEWKLCLTGTPAPNDRIEYANHAVFLDQFPTVNSFLAKFFVNRGQTDNRWELKPHALRPFYRALSHWCIFLSDPAVYGWKDNTAPLPPINTHVIDVPLTDEQHAASMAAGGGLFGNAVGGIAGRGVMARIAKGFAPGGRAVESNKPAVVADLAAGGSGGSIVWCKYNAEQEGLADLMPGAANVSGDTPDDERETLIDGFKAGRTKTLLTKPKILGFGLNLQVATRHVFSTVQDSYEEYYQAVKRSNRYGSTQPLDVYLPVTELERPMLDTVLRKAKQIQDDTREQEQLFKEIGHAGF